MIQDIDIRENDIFQQDHELLETLLVDHSRPKSGRKPSHIIWATDNYQSLGPEYGENEQISIKSISGEHGNDNAQFFIRGVTTFGYSQNPLILIDNIESSTSDLARLATDDIASFSIMKDATATAIYGARGANGVLLITTKTGREGKLNVSARVETSLSMPTKRIEMVDPIDYMYYQNEATITRDPLAIRPNSDEKIANTINGTNPYVYPNVDWYKELFNDYVTNYRANASVSGGGKLARYYVSLGLFQTDGGCNATPQYEIASPVFEKAVIHLDGRYGRGDRFVITAHDASRNNIYVQRATLNGQPWNRFRFDASELLKGGELELWMGPEPNQEWGVE